VKAGRVGHQTPANARAAANRYFRQIRWRVRREELR
jgi:hypothetical protein